MTTSEPTTGEIVGKITNQSTTYDIIVVLKMIVQYLESFTMDKMSRDVMNAAADRLESQEREIERLKEELEQMEEAATVLHAANETHWTYIKEQTARALAADAGKGENHA